MTSSSWSGWRCGAAPVPGSERCSNAHKVRAPFAAAAINRVVTPGRHSSTVCPETSRNAMPAAYLAYVTFWSGRDWCLRRARTTATWSRGGPAGARLSRHRASGCPSWSHARRRVHRRHDQTAALVGGGRPKPPSRHFVDLESIVEYDSVITFRRIAAHVAVEDVDANALGVALEADLRSRRRRRSADRRPSRPRVDARLPSTSAARRVGRR